MVDEAIRFAIWPVHPETVAANLARFSAAEDVTVALSIFDDYRKEMAARFRDGTAPDVFYAQRAEAAEWHAQGWIDATWCMPAELEGMHPSLVRSTAAPDGALLGSTYYAAGPFALLQRADIAVDHFPHWHNVLEFLREAKRDRLAEHPYLPRWHTTQTGLVWSLLTHIATEGVLDLRQDGAFDAIRDCLGFFADLAREELVPPASLSDRSDVEALQRFAGGRHLLFFTIDYMAADARGMAGRPFCVPASRLPGRVGTALMPGHALICVRSGLDAGRKAQAVRLARFLGNRETHRRWASQHLFPVAWPALYEEAGVRDAIEAFWPAAHAARGRRHLVDARVNAVASVNTSEPHMLAWSDYADCMIRHDLLSGRRIEPAAASERLLRQWSRLADECREAADG